MKWAGCKYKHGRAKNNLACFEVAAQLRRGNDFLKWLLFKIACTYQYLENYFYEKKITLHPG